MTRPATPICLIPSRLTPFMAVLLCLTFPLVANAQGEYPQAVLSSAIFGGVAPGDVTHDTANAQVYVVDTFTGDTLIYTESLALVTTIISPFPAGHFVTGIAAGNGIVFWSVYDPVLAVNNLWAAPSVAAAPTNGGALPLPAGEVVVGIDTDLTNPNALYVNGFVTNQNYVVDPIGLTLLSTCANVTGLSLGISHRGGPWVEQAGDALGVGTPTHWFAQNTTNCLQLDPVGIPFYLPGIVIGGWDYSRPTATGGPTITGVDWATFTLFRVTVHQSFIRGNADSLGGVNTADVSYILSFLLAAGPPPPCFDAADVDDSGAVNLTDAIFLANFLAGAAAPPAPFPVCGHDPTPDPMRCDRSGPLCP